MTSLTSPTEIIALKSQINRQDVELTALHLKLILSENKVKKLQDSEYRLEEALHFWKTDKKLIIGQSVLDHVCK